MMKNLYLTGGLALLILIIGGTFYTKYENQKDTIALMQAQMATIKADSAADKAQVSQAHIQADAALQQANKNSQAIMQQKVSPDCAEAIEWAIKQAKVINK